MLRTKGKKRVTLQDVAAQAGVSVATASVAITGRRSGNCRVSPTVAENIRRAARQLNYRPNIQARNLSMQRTQTIAMLVKRCSWHNSMQFLSASQRVLRQRGYTEIFLVHKDDTIEAERAHLEMCIQRRVEGIISFPLIDIHGQANAELMNEIREQEGIPIVQISIAIPGCAAPAVLIDETRAMFDGVRALYDLGHRRIAHATLAHYEDPSELNPYRHAHLRYVGYQAAMRELGLPEQVLVAPRPPEDVTSEFDHAYQHAEAIAKMPHKPTAILGYSDYQAAGLLAGLTDSGISVPKQISLLGFGDQDFTRMSRPSLATLAPAYERIGALATEKLFDLIEGRPAESEAVPTTLILRDSVARV